MIKSRFNVVIIMNLIIATSFSQNSINTSDYGEWYEIYNGDVSNDGKWMFYRTKHQMEEETLHVIEVNGDKRYEIPSGKEGQFTSNNKYFTAYVNKDKIQIINLQKDSITLVEKIIRRQLSADERFLILEKNDETSSLLIKHLDLGTEILIPNVEEFSINPSHNKIALIMEKNGEYSINLLNLNSYSLTTIRNRGGYNYNSLTWNNDGKYLAALEYKINDSAKKQKIVRFSCLKDKKVEVNSKLISEATIVDNSLEISQNGNLIYYKSLPLSIPIDTLKSKGIQVWKTSDKWIYPRREVNNLLSPKPKLWLWNYRENKVCQITDSLLSEVIKVNDDLILKYDKQAYEPQFEYVPHVDFYLHNVNTGHSQVFLKKQKLNEVFVDPEGKYIVFFKDQNWWAYNIYFQKTINLSHDLDVSFFDLNNDNDSKKIPFSKRIKWIEEENAILVCDEFDVWMLGLDGKIKNRLTQGREINRSYHFFVDFLNQKKINQNTVNLKNGFLLKTTDENRNTGYFLWKSKEELKKLAFGPFLVDVIKWDENMRYFTFRIESYNMPPKIILYNRTNDTITTMVKSNSNQTLKNWGEVVTMPFTLSTGEKSKVSLIYPVNYDSSKKYPMIVDVYEKQTKRIHEFFPISWYSSIGFNPAHYALDGYFVLMPDITYEIGNVGLSANQYVNESIDFILQKENIDENRIGIIGHSFGGYETAFIVTQTNRFAAAVAGAAVTDMPTFYHTINWISGQEEMFRFENYQMRMGASYFDLKENYLNNSPFHHVENVFTPLLLWTGGNELHINFNESIRFYLALRRLNKNAELLLFENEGHVIIDMDRREYLSNRIKKWFDKYCK